MNSKILTMALLITAAFLAGCGDENDRRITDTEAACLKLLTAGGSCSSLNTAATTTTSTTTVTVTSTTTVQ